MSTQEIIAELPKLKPDELRLLRKKLAEMEAADSRVPQTKWDAALLEIAGLADELPSDLSINHGEIQDGALHLSPKEKAALIDLLWDSLGREELLQLERKWAIEAEDRVDAFERGELLAENGPDALKILRKSLRR